MENYRVFRTDDELMHYGVKGMKWGIRRKQPRMTYEQKVRKKMDDYHKANKGRRRSDNNTIVLKKEQRNLYRKQGIASTASILGIQAALLGSPIMSLPLASASAVALAGSSYVNYKKNIALTNLIDENTIPNSTRVMQVGREMYDRQ